MPPESETAQPLVPQDILRATDAALEEHGRWLTRLHRALVCGLEPEADLVASDSETLSAFGRWHEMHSGDPLLSQAAFQELWETYAALHDEARRTAAMAARGRVDPEEYDRLAAQSEAFQTQARRIRDAFRKAVSDLDPLTGLSNRTTMTAELTAEYERAVRTGSPCCIALSDIDHFKKVNDTYGHGVGDQVLAAAAGRFLSRMRPYDLIYRYGGEEFLFCLPNADGPTAAGVLDRLREALCDRPIPMENGEDLPVTASFGYARIDGAVPLKEVIERADQALYRAKQGGRNRVEGFGDGG
jgi:diguanylate cyclase (GGDEF)-like protein